MNTKVTDLEIVEIAKKYFSTDLFKMEIPLLTIFDKDIFGIVKYKNKPYSIYILQDRTLIKDNKLLNIKEILITDFTITNLEKLLHNEISIYDFLKKANKYSIGKINNKHFPIKEIKDLAKIEDKIVGDGIYLNLSAAYIQEVFIKIK